MSQTKFTNTLEFPEAITTGNSVSAEQTPPAEKKSIHVGCPSFLEFGTKDSTWNSIGTDHILHAFDQYYEMLKAAPDSDPKKEELLTQLRRGQFDAGKWWNFVSKEVGKNPDGSPKYVNVDTPELVREFLAAHQFLFHMKMGPNTLYFKSAKINPLYMVKAPYASLSYTARQQMMAKERTGDHKPGALLKVDVEVMYNPTNNHIFFVAHDRYPRANTITVKMRVDEQQNLSFLAWLPGNDLRDPIMTPEQIPVRCGLRKHEVQLPPIA
jgi:hypothetical protein